MDKELVILRPVQDSDIEQMRIWLNKNYILKWYKDADEWLNELKERNGEFRFLNHFIVYRGNEPIGFCQYYDCFDAKEDWYVVEDQNTLFSIDYFIGEEKYLRKGLGKVIIQMLMEMISKRAQVFEVIAQPDLENIPSNRVLLASGFVFDAVRKYYTIKMS